MKGAVHSIRFLGLLISIFIIVSCNPRPAVLIPTPDSNATALTVVEAAIVSADVDTPNHFEFFNRIPSEVSDRYATWQYPPPDEMVKAPNGILAPFGYRLEQNPIMSSYSFRLFRNAEMILDGISHFWSVTVKSDGTDFVMQVEVNNGSIALVRSGRVQEWQADRHFFISPIYAGNRFATANDTNGHVAVMEDGAQAFSMPAVVTAENPVKGLTAWGGRWVLEVDGIVIMDGENLNVEYGYEKIFNWTLIAGQPFYFIMDEPGSDVQVSYAGKVLSQSYQEVIHYACCEPAAFNPQFNEHMITFYGRRNGTWYHVQMGVFGE